MPVEFPFVKALPKREKSRLVKLWEHFAAVRLAMDQHGVLVPVALAAGLADVSKQRIHEVMNDGRLVRIELNGHPYVTENSLVEWAKSERKAGRPWKDRTKSEQWKLAKNLAGLK